MGRIKTRVEKIMNTTSDKLKRNRGKKTENVKGQTSNIYYKNIN